MPTLLAFASLLGSKPGGASRRTHPSHKSKDQDEQDWPAQSDGGSRAVQVHGVRLLELTERNSTVMQVAEVDEYSAFDPVLNTFRVLGQLYNLAVSGEVAIVPQSSYAETLVSRASEESSDLLVLPWSETSSMSEAHTITKEQHPVQTSKQFICEFCGRNARWRSVQHCSIYQQGFHRQS